MDKNDVSGNLINDIARIHLELSKLVDQLDRIIISYISEHQEQENKNEQPKARNILTDTTPR